MTSGQLVMIASLLELKSSEITFVSKELGRCQMHQTQTWGSKHRISSVKPWMVTHIKYSEIDSVNMQADTNVSLSN